MLKLKRKMKQNLKKGGSVKGFLLLLLLVFSAFTSTNLQAQQRLSGVVSDTGGLPVPGVSVVQKGTTNGAVTDFDGNYSLKLIAGKKILVFSYLGYESQEIAIGTQNKISVNLKESAESLDEIVIIGYAPISRKKVLGSVATVKSEEVVQATPIGAFDAVQGKLAGVQILSNGGPGGGFDIRVRGVSTFSSGGTTPLYVVDGQQLDDIDNIDPNDIESLEVLKDGATAAVYGSKAANGVVLITTKSGKNGELKVDITNVTGINSLVGDLRLANANQRIDYDKASASNTIALSYNERDSLSLINRNSFDVQKLITRPAVRQQTNVAVSGGSDKLKFYWNTGFLNEKGVVINSGYKRINTLLKGDMTFSKKLKVGVKVNLSFEEKFGLSEGSVFTHLVQRIPYYPIFEPNGEYSPEIFGRQNPLAETLIENKTRDYRIQFFGYAQLELFPKLTLKSTFGINNRLRKFNGYVPFIAINPNSSIPFPQVRETFTNSYDVQQENFLNYSNNWGDHSLGAFAGMSIQRYSSENLDLEAYLLSDAVQSLNNIDVASLSVRRGAAENSRHALYGMFAGFNYDYKNRYLLSATYRRDGSSRFGENNKYGNFPSLSVGWRVSNEEFLKGNDLINDLKLKASYGVVGNERISNYDFTGALTPGYVYNNINGVAPTRLGNPDLKWEETTSLNLGFELGMFKNRFNLNVDLWEKKTTDLLANLPLPEESGFSSIRTNVGAINNRGVDVALNGTIIKKKNFSWNSSFNVSYLENEVVKLSGGTPFFSGRGNSTYIEEGQPLGNINGWKNLGVFQYDESNAYTPEGVRLNPNFDDTGSFVNYTLNGAEYSGTVAQMKNAGKVLLGGDIIWEDLNNDFDITADDRQTIGNGLANVFGGFTNNFKYKNFGFSFLFDYSFGNDIYRYWDEDRNDLNTGGETPGPDRIEGAWRNQGDVTVYPRLTRSHTQNRERPNSFFVTEGDYIKLRYIRLNYDVSNKIMNKIKGVSKISLNLAVNNVLTWTNYIGFNPELGSRGNPLAPGIDELRYPNDREIILGLKIQLK